MPSLALLGATGKLGRHVATQALAGGWALSVAVRSRGRLDPSVAASARIRDLDLATAAPAAIADFADGQDAFVSCAGLVTEGEGFVRLVSTLVSGLELLPAGRRPVVWFLAGAALLPLDARGRRGVDLPKVRGTYWPHAANYQRLLLSPLDWRLLCPGPMVDEPAIGLARLRIGFDALPAGIPAAARWLPAPLLLPLFAAKIPQMIVPYADAASVMLAHMQPGDAASRRRVGVALPEGMKGRKAQWSAKPPGGA